MTAPTATSALPGSGSQLANITGKSSHTTGLESKGTPVDVIASALSKQSHELARALHCPGQKLSPQGDEMPGLFAAVMMWGGQGHTD